MSYEPRGSRSSLGYSRRPVPVTELEIERERVNLQDELYNLEYEMKYLGDIPGVSMDTDTTNRTEVLKIIDRGKKQGLIPLHLSYDHDALLYLNKYTIKVAKRDGQDQVLLKLPCMEIAQCCYVKEDGVHILAIKHGTQESLNLAVLHCETQAIAESFCSLVSHCFQLVYTDVMIELIEDTIDKAIVKDESISVSSSSTPTGNAKPSFYTRSITNLPALDSPRHSNQAPSDISRASNESSQAEVLRDYMWQLHTKLKFDELAKFSNLLKSWNYSSNRLPEFCEKLLNLYGPERKHLLAGMFPFIPERDCPYFENFLKQHDINLPENGTGTLNSIQGLPTYYSRSVSEASIASNAANSSDADLTSRADSVLDAIGKKMERIDLSVGDPTQYYIG